MLPRHGLMIGDDDVAGLESAVSIAIHAILNDGAQVGNEMRDAAHILRNERAVRSHERCAKVAHLIDHHVVRGAVEVGRHLIGNSGQRVSDDFQRDGIKLLCHRSLPNEMRSSPVLATVRSSPGNTTVVEPYSLTSAGPVNCAPGGKSSREKTVHS